jgi:hypothetical protein
MTNPMTAVGDVIKGGTAGAPQRLAIGSNGQVLTVAAGAPAWQTPAAPGMANPMTAQGDLITGGAAGVPTRLPIAPNAYSLLRSDGTTPQWSAGPALRTLELGDTADPSLWLAPPGGQTYQVTAGGAGSATPNQYRVANLTDGTTPLAIHSDRVEVANRYLAVGHYPANNVAHIRITASGGHQYDIAAGGTGSAYPGALWIHDLTTGRTKLRIEANGDISLDLNSQGMRPIWFGGVDSGGAGFRAVIIPNNPS